MNELFKLRGKEWFPVFGFSLYEKRILKHKAEFGEPNDSITKEYLNTACTFHILYVLALVLFLIIFFRTF